MKPLYIKRRTIGLLGGSFNPAHEGHLHISAYALGKLKMDAVWWLVSPQNPLKSKSDMGDYESRFASAQKIAAHKNIFVSDIEKRFGTRYTFQTLTRLKRRYPGTKFIWLMGADNLAHFHRWQRWRDILRLVPVVVFDRAPYSYSSVASPTAARMRRFLLNNHADLRKTRAPALFFARLPRDGHSATAIRKTLGKFMFLGHTKVAG